MALCERSVTDALAEFVREHPNKTALYYLNAEGDIHEQLSYTDLDDASSSLSTYLMNNCNLKVGEKVLLAFLPGLSFAVATIACFKAGLTAIPIFPPDPTKQNLAIQKDCSISVVLTHSAYNEARKLGDLKNLFSWSDKSSQWPSLEWILIDDFYAKSKSSKSSGHSTINTYQTPKDQLAYLLYTSSANLNGVLVTQGSLEQNIKLQAQQFSLDKNTIGITWLPQSNEMGLVGGLLSAIYIGYPLYVMSPSNFLQDPTSLLRNISKYRATFTITPSFALATISRKFTESKCTVDLSSIQTIVNGTEPIDTAVTSEFVRIFSQHGLSSTAIESSYGLAENTLLVCAGGETVLHVDKSALGEGQVVVKGSEPFHGCSDRPLRAEIRRIASTGKVVNTATNTPEIIIVNPVTREQLSDDNVGEIWINSSSKVSGYFNKEEYNGVTFGALLAGSTTGDVTFLRSGDLGFLHNNELFFCERMQEVITINGITYYPSDIEKTVEISHDAVRKGSTVVFSIQPSSQNNIMESVIVLTEVKETVLVSTYPDIINIINQQIQAENHLRVSCICILNANELFKTTTGQLSREWNRKLYLEKSLRIAKHLDIVVESQPRVPRLLPRTSSKLSTVSTTPVTSTKIISEKVPVAVVTTTSTKEVPYQYEAHIAGWATSFPPPCSTSNFLRIDREIRTKLGQSEAVIKAMQNVSISSGIKTRFYCHPFFFEKGQSTEGRAGVMSEDIFGEDCDPPYHTRMACYRETCVKLCIDAARKAIARWGQDVKNISHILTTCTSGWEEPGIACAVMKALNLSEDCQKAELNFNGCFCGATCLRLARDIIRSGSSTGVLIVACEVASTHMNWKTTEMQHMVAQCLFTDGAASIVVGREGLWKFESTGSSIVPNSNTLLGLRPPINPGEKSYYMTLSPHVGPSLREYFTNHHGKDIMKKLYNPSEPRAALAVHPGGPKILEAMGHVFSELGWAKDALDSSFDTFANHGNLGSAAMLLVLSNRLSNNDIHEDKLISMAFGPGVTVEWATYSKSKNYVMPAPLELPAIISSNLSSYSLELPASDAQTTPSSKTLSQKSNTNSVKLDSIKKATTSASTSKGTALVVKDNTSFFLAILFGVFSVGIALGLLVSDLF